MTNAMLYKDEIKQIEEDLENYDDDIAFLYNEHKLIPCGKLDDCVGCLFQDAEMYFNIDDCREAYEIWKERNFNEKIEWS